MPPVPFSFVKSPPWHLITGRRVHQGIGPESDDEVGSAHESWDDTMEGRVSVAHSFFAGAERSEVFRSLGHDAAKQAHLDAAGWLSSDSHIEVDRFCDLSIRRPLLGQEVLKEGADHPRMWRTQRAWRTRRRDDQARTASESKRNGRHSPHRDRR